MAGGTSGSQELTKGARITGDQRSTLASVLTKRYSDGESIRSIAEDTGRSYGFVHGVLKESGATLRGRGGATRGNRRGPVDKVADRVATSAEVAVADGASAVRTKAKSGRDKLDKKTAKDDKAKKKPEHKAKKAAKTKKSTKKG